MRPSKRKRVNDAVHTVNVSRMLSLSTIKDEANVFSTVPVVALLTSSKIHLDLSNIWNDYKVEKIALTATPLNIEDLDVEEGGVISRPREYLKLFCAWDNNDVSHQLRYSDIKAYESYRDVTFSINASNETPILRFNANPKMKTMDTKKTPNYGTLIIGINSPITFGESVNIDITVNFTFTVCYGSPRLDTSWVSTLIAPEFVQLPDTRPPIIKEVIVEVPVPQPPICRYLRIENYNGTPFDMFDLTDDTWQTGTGSDIAIPPNHHLFYWTTDPWFPTMWVFSGRDNEDSRALVVGLAQGQRYLIVNKNYGSYNMTLMTPDETRIAIAWFQEDAIAAGTESTKLCVNKSFITFPPGMKMST